MVLDCVRRHKLESRIILQSFDFRTLHAMKALAPGMRLSALYEKGPDSFVDIARRARAPIVSPETDLVTPQKVKAAHAAGLQVPLVDHEDGRLVLLQDVTGELLVHLADADARVVEVQHHVLLRQILDASVAELVVRPDLVLDFQSFAARRTISSAPGSARSTWTTSTKA
jgi:glycerophosphoryl diester phosphodiesterase